MKQPFLKEMITLAFEAGKIALDNIHDSKPSLKSDNSIVTESDTAISQLARYNLDKFLQTRKHILIDEESTDRKKYLNKSILQKTPYIWAIDPIDGTHLYANGIPHYGISIGLIKDLKPYLGIVYFPALNELFFNDSKQAYFVVDAFRRSSTRHVIKPLDEKISKQSLLHCNDNFYRKHRHYFLGIDILVSACAIVDLCWPAIGRGCGAIFKSSLWDFAGSWPIFEAAGLSLRCIKTGKTLKKIDTGLFDQKKSAWMLKDYYILSSKRNFDVIKKKLNL